MVLKQRRWMMDSLAEMHHRRRCW